MTSLHHDLRYAFRQLARSPGFTAVAIIILGLGIGANSTMFTLVHSLFLQSPPGISAPEDVIRFNRTSQFTSAGSISYPDYSFYRENNQTFTGVTAYGRGLTLLTARTGSNLIPVDAQLVAGNFFDVLGIPMSVGRGFRVEEDEVPDAYPVAVVSHDFWQRSLGGDAGVAGATLHLNGRQFTIVGVATQEFRGLGPAEQAPDVWLPLMMRSMMFTSPVDWTRRIQGETDLWLTGLARVRPGVSVSAATDDMSRLARQLEADFPDWNSRQGIVVTGRFQYDPNVRRRLATLSRLLVAVAAVILLIAAANLAILLLTRASARQREVGVRIALGAGRGRIVRQLLVESLVLAFLGSSVGIVLASWFTDAAAALIPVSFHITFRPNAMVFGWTLVVGVVAALLFGLAPAWLASRSDVVSVIKGTLRYGRQSLFRNGLVVTQVALAVLLVMGASLFVRSLQSAQSVDLGFATENRLLLRVNLRNHGYSRPDGVDFVRQALERLRELPGVTHGTTTSLVPLSGGEWSGSYAVDGVAPPPDQSGFQSGFNAVGPEYFQTMNIPILSGRGFTEADNEQAPFVAVVNEATARSVWGDRDPIGDVIVRGETQFTVIGVAKNAMYYALGEDPQLQIYFAELQVYRPRVDFVLATRQDPSSLIRSAERALHALDPNLAISNVRTLDDLFRDTTGRYRLSATVLSLFGVLALVLASIGLYGVLSFTVVQATRDLGIRVALGAQRGQVVGLVVTLGLKLAAMGIVIGAITGLGLSATVRSFLFEVSPLDPLTLVLAPVVLIGVAVAASYLPARRASRIDPVVALRYE